MAIIIFKYLITSDKQSHVYDTTTITAIVTVELSYLGTGNMCSVLQRAWAGRNLFLPFHQINKVKDKKKRETTPDHLTGYVH